MEPRIVYIEDKSKTVDCPTEVRPVIIEGYRDQISLDYFNHGVLKIAYDLSLKHKTMPYSPYDRIFKVWDKQSLDMYNKTHSKLGGVIPLINVVGSPVTLKDYYKEIGYDYKKKRINGLTWKQRIMEHVGAK